MYNLAVFLIVMILLATALMYNTKILAFLAKLLPRTENLFYRLLGKRIKYWNLQVERKALIKRGSFTYKWNKYFQTIIVNLGMAKDNVTPTGLVTFITTLALVIAIAFVFWTGDFSLFLPALFVMFYFIVVTFRFLSLMAFERKEAEIMDTEDLIAMDINEGVYNAILRYQHSFHPNIQPYFSEFIDNKTLRGFSFEESMLLLSEKLGVTFEDFAQKAILFEEKADDTMADIFAGVVELNRNKRMLRYKNNRRFKEIRLQFLLSVVIIGVYGFFSISSDAFMSNFFENTFFGKILLLGDIVIVTGVLSYLSAIKTKLL